MQKIQEVFNKIALRQRIGIQKLSKIDLRDREQDEKVEIALRRNENLNCLER